MFLLLFLRLSLPAAAVFFPPRMLFFLCLSRSYVDKNGTNTGKTPALFTIRIIVIEEDNGGGGVVVVVSKED